MNISRVLSKFTGKKKEFIFLILPLVLSSLGFLSVILDRNPIWILFISLICSFFVFVSWIYGLHPAFIKTKKFFSKRGYEYVLLLLFKNGDTCLTLSCPFIYS